MELFELTENRLSLLPAYDIRAVGAGGAALTVKARALAASLRLALTDQQSGRELASLAGNLIWTRFAITDPCGLDEWGSVDFPFLAFRPHFRLAVGRAHYRCHGGLLSHAFRVLDQVGRTVLDIKRPAEARGGFHVSINGPIRREVALLAAVAVDRKYGHSWLPGS